MNKKALLLIFILLLLPRPTAATSEFLDGSYYIVYDNYENELFATGSTVVVGDMYQSADDFLYKVVRVDADEKKAWAEFLHKVEYDQKESAIDGMLPVDASDVIVGIYQTHSSESYISGDGTESKKGKGGIVDVGQTLADELEKNGIKTIFSDDGHTPHDAGAYQRSRRTAMSLIKKGADILVDVHRDAIPAKYYSTNVDGDKVSKVRLVVGRQNPNQNANKEFAQKLKQIADDKYPGLIKDIYFARGGYNQDLGPRTILIEVGSHKVSKEQAKKGAELFAGVMGSYLGSNPNFKNTGSTRSIAFLVIGTLIVIGAFMFMNYGSWAGIKKNVIEPSRKRYASALASWRKRKDD